MPDSKKDADQLISEIIPAEEIQKLEEGRVEEILQPLLDLGYIVKAEKSLLPDGIRQFRKDYLSQNLLPDFKPNFLFLPETELESKELNLLHTLTSLDGDFILKQWPQAQEINLASRIIHYRISLHQLDNIPSEQPFSDAVKKALDKIRKWISNLPGEDLDLINLLGDVPNLLKHISSNQNGQLHKKIVH